MDSADSCDKPLTGVSFPTWVKTSPTYDYSEICSSPPTNPDGFFHMKKRNLTINTADEKKSEIECYKVVKNEAPPEIFKVPSVSSITTLAMSQASSLVTSDKSQPKDLKTSASTPGLYQYGQEAEIRAAKSALKSSGNQLRLVEKITENLSVPCTPDITPNATPTVTPYSSPKLSRRLGNPFFTGNPNSGGTGSWLFRSSNEGTANNKERQNIAYEVKVDKTTTTNSSSNQSDKKPVRYVPRPSELRELNFWSPTSM